MLGDLFRGCEGRVQFVIPGAQRPGIAGSFGVRRSRIGFAVPDDGLPCIAGIAWNPHSPLEGAAGVNHPGRAAFPKPEVRVDESGKQVLRRAFRRLEQELPDQGARYVRKLRHPDARWIRIPAGVLLVIGSVFSILPVLGIWMLPLGLLLLAYDIPFLRRPMGRFTLWGADKWAALRQRWQRWRGR
jgi:hypothetical protein